VPQRHTRKSVAQQLRQAVEDSGLSFHELGRRADVNAAQLSRFMTAGRDLTLAVASRLCAVLGMDLVQSRKVCKEPLGARARGGRTKSSQDLAASLNNFTLFPRGQGFRADLDGPRKKRQRALAGRARGGRRK
jgi:transcriptional regulator with XRE-family HTH domain